MGTRWGIAGRHSAVLCIVVFVVASCGGGGSGLPDLSDIARVSASQLGESCEIFTVDDAVAVHPDATQLDTYMGGSGCTFTDDDGLTVTFGASNGEDWNLIADRGAGGLRNSYGGYEVEQLDGLGTDAYLVYGTERDDSVMSVRVLLVDDNESIWTDFILLVIALDDPEAVNDEDLRARMVEVAESLTDRVEELFEAR